MPSEILFQMWKFSIQYNIFTLLKEVGIVVRKPE